MTPRLLLDWLAGESAWVGGYLAALPALALVLGAVHRRGAGNDAPWKFAYSLLVYAACVPGMFGAVVTLGPVASMGATLAIAGRNVAFGPLPGFGRLSGLMTVLGLTFGVLFALSRTRVWLVFGGSMALLGALGAFVFALFMWGGYMAFRRRDEPERAAPKFGG